MEITLSLSDMLTLGLSVCGIVLLIYLIVAVAKLIPTLKELTKSVVTLNSILEEVDATMKDVNVISDKAKDGVTAAADVVSELSKASRQVGAVMKDDKNVVSAATHLVNAAAGLTKLMKDPKK